MIAHYSKGSDKHIDQLNYFIRDIRLTFNMLKSLGDSLYEDLQITTAHRAVIEFIAIEGESTVPMIAEQRSVSRQAIQKTVNQLLEMEFVTTIENPEHKRSQLISLTSDGEKLFKTITRREKLILNRICKNINSVELKSANKVLEKLRYQFIKQ